MRIVFDPILRVSAAVRAYAGGAVHRCASRTIRLRTAGSAILTAFVLVACGQRGPLYLPTIPPLPPTPTAHSAASATGSGDSASPPASDAAETSDANDPAATPSTAASGTMRAPSDKGMSGSTGNTVSGSK